ncbi:MAG: acylneuraminate cytidylyltransferase family protein [Methanotrichaceae archaeon]|nr:acylneuraminate cytidylyltransferase family protein [Methanotrichaceae archaeon]
MKNDILAVIPARGGSKGLPGKNIALLKGRPLIAYTIEAAFASRYVSRIVVSTDDVKIGEASRDHGAEVLMRPSHLAGDETPTVSVLMHVLDQMGADSYLPDIVVLLQPTSPLRSACDIDEALATFLHCNSDSLVSVSEMDHSPYWSLKIEGGLLQPIFGQACLNLRRQELPKTYLPNGAIFISRPEVIRRDGGFYSLRTAPYIMPRERSVDIDCEFDLLLVELLMRSCEARGDTDRP